MSKIYKVRPKNSSLCKLYCRYIIYETKIIFLNLEECKESREISRNKRSIWVRILPCQLPGSAHNPNPDM